MFLGPQGACDELAVVDRQGLHDPDRRPRRVSDRRATWQWTQRSAPNDRPRDGCTF